MQTGEWDHLVCTKPLTVVTWGDAHVYNMVIHYVCTHTESDLDWWGLSLSTLQDCQNILQQAPL